MTLTPFELAAAGIAFSILIGIIAWLLKDKVERVERDHAKEVEARKAGDSELTVALAKIIESLRNISEGNIREHGEFARADNVRESHAKMYTRIDEVKEICTRIESKMVTQEQCRQRCADA